MTNHFLLPSIPTGYDLYPCNDPWGIVVPVARRNLVINPSVETNTTGYTAVGGSIARTTAQQYHGAYSLAVTPGAGTTDGVYYGTVSLTSGTTYAVSCKVRGAAGRAYKLWAATTGGAALATYSFIATGRWQWVWLFWAETSSTTRRIYVTKDGDTNITPFYLDGLQVEACGSEGVFVTTYIDGDQPGLVPNQQPPAYLWEGTRHASISQRSGQTRAGGRVIPLSRFGLIITAIVGLGMVPPQHIAAPFAQLDGASYDRTRKPPRQFSLVGRFSAANVRDLRTGIAEASAALDRDRVGQQQPLVLRYAEQESDAATIPALYAGGLEGNSTNPYAEDVSMQFVQYMPMILSERENGAALTPRQSLANVYILKRDPSGVWSALGTGAQGVASLGDGPGSIITAPNGLVYVGGGFTGLGGVANTRLIGAWNGSAWSALGTGLTGGTTAAAAAIDSLGRLYVGGDFTDAGGVANTARIARWTGSAWESIATGGANGTVTGIAIDPSNGYVYVTGDFTTIGGVAATRIAMWNGSVWSALGTGLNATGIAVVVGPSGYVYAGGLFTSAGGVSGTGYIARWTGSAWESIASGGASDVVATLAFGPDNTLYAGGLFTAIGGVSASCIARWNGVAWEPLGGGVTAPSSTAQITNISIDRMGRLTIAGLFETAGGIAIPDSLANWGGTWTQLDIDLPGVGITNATRTAGDGTLYLAYGYGSAGTPITAATTTITNTSTAKTYPVLTITGPSSGTSRVYQIVNATTGRAIYLDYTINAGETATLQFAPTALAFTSDYQGNIASTILPGSSEADFFLQPGENVISFFTASDTVTATLRWRPSFVTLHDIARAAP